MQWSYVRSECVPLYRQLAMATTARLFDSREAIWHLPGCADTVGLSSGVSFCSRWTNVESQSKEFERNRNINFQSSKTRCLFTIDCNSNKESKRELNICTSLVYQGLEKRLWQVCIRWNHTVLLQPEFLHKTAHPRLSDSHKGVWFQNQSHRLVLQNNSWSSQQLIDHTVGNSHQWKKTCISPSKHINNNKEPLWPEEKKINTKENIERDQRKVQYAKQKNYCTPILLHAQDVFPVMFLQEKEARERRHFFLWFFPSIISSLLGDPP